MLLSVFLSLSRDLILPGPNGAVGVQFSIGALKCLLPNEEQMPHKQALNKFVHLSMCEHRRHVQNQHVGLPNRCLFKIIWGNLDWHNLPPLLTESRPIAVWSQRVAILCHHILEIIYSKPSTKATCNDLKSVVFVTEGRISLIRKRWNVFFKLEEPDVDFMYLNN